MAKDQVKLESSRAPQMLAWPRVAPIHYHHHPGKKFFQRQIAASVGELLGTVSESLAGPDISHRQCRCRPDHTGPRSTIGIGPRWPLTREGQGSGRPATDNSLHFPAAAASKGWASRLWSFKAAQDHRLWAKSWVPMIGCKQASGRPGVRANEPQRRRTLQRPDEFINGCCLFCCYYSLV